MKKESGSAKGPDSVISLSFLANFNVDTANGIMDAKSDRVMSFSRMKSLYLRYRL